MIEVPGQANGAPQFQPALILMVAPDGQSFQWTQDKNVPLSTMTLAAAVTQLQGLAIAALMPQHGQVMQAADPALVQMLRRRGGMA